MTGLLIFFAAIGLLATLGLLLLGVWLVVAGDRMEEHWPGLDEEPTLNVQNGIGDSRPVQPVSDVWIIGPSSPPDPEGPWEIVGDSRPLR
jgi:hypothetical protein